jgi:predicted DNA-binding protein YlxM (UPF0122 family)
MTAYELRTIDRLSFREIGKELGISHVQAIRDVVKAIEEIREEQIQKIEVRRTKENRKLDVVELALLKEIETSIILVKDEKIEIDGVNPAIINSYLRLQERRAKLNGLDVPVKQEFDFNFRRQVDEEYKDKESLAIEEAKRILKEVE